MDYLVAVDIGTTSTKVVLFDQAGQTIRTANHGYPLLQTTPEMAEQDPQVIFKAVTTGLKEALQGFDWQTTKLLGISFSAAMHSLLLLDANHQPLTKVITWADNRAQQAAAKLKAAPTAAADYQRTGTPIHPMTPYSKLTWLQSSQPALVQKAAYFVGIKTYVIWQLFGELVADYSLANATGYFNLHQLDWDTEILARLAIKRNQLPKLVDTDYLLASLKDNYAKEFNIPSSTPGIIGASDGCLANLGVGALDNQTLAFTMGTSGAVRIVSDQPKLDPAGRLFCYYLAPNRWVIGGPVNNGGIVLQWARDTLFKTDTREAEQMHLDPLTILVQRAMQAPVGARGLLFLPYLGGERAPLWDANARGSFIGLTRQHQQADLLRAVMEGILFNLATVTHLLTNLTGPIKQIRAAGGFAHSTDWTQMLANIFDQPVAIPTTVESSCLGAAIIGFKAVGKLNSLAAGQQFIKTKQLFQPQVDAVKTYQQLVPLYRKYNRLLANQYQDLAKFQDQ